MCCLLVFALFELAGEVAADAFVSDYHIYKEYIEHRELESEV